MSRPLALTGGAETTLPSPITAELRRMGWQVRVVADDLQAWTNASADLWVFDLPRRKSDPLDFLYTLSDRPAISPLLIETNTECLESCGHALIRLLDTWTEAADFIVRPVVPAELRIRVQWLTTYKARWDKYKTILDFGALRLDTDRQEVSFEGQSLHLSPSEFRILVALVQSQGGTISKRGLSRILFGSAERYDEHLIESHVSRLRRKLSQAGCPTDTIHAVRDEGYLLDIGRLMNS